MIRKEFCSYAEYNPLRKTLKDSLAKRAWAINFQRDWEKKLWGPFENPNYKLLFNLVFVTIKDLILLATTLGFEKRWNFILLIPWELKNGRQPQRLKWTPCETHFMQSTNRLKMNEWPFYRQFSSLMSTYIFTRDSNHQSSNSATLNPTTGNVIRADLSETHMESFSQHYRAYIWYSNKLTNFRPVQQW